MSFWKTIGDLAGKAGKAAFEAASDAKDRHSDYVLEYGDDSDTELFQALAQSVKRQEMVKAMAIRKILLERGYTNPEINEIVKTYM